MEKQRKYEREYLKISQTLLKKIVTVIFFF